MVRPKLSFDRKEDRVTAIADFIRENVSSIEFVGEMRERDVQSAKDVFVTASRTEEGGTHWNINGEMSLKYGYDEYGSTLGQRFSFAGSCRMERGNGDVPVVSDLKLIRIDKV